MLIRKNSKEFKAIKEIVVACQDKPTRDQLIRLFITKAGHTIKDRISIEGIEGGSALFYDMTYQTVLNNLHSADRQLQESDDIPGIYYFHSASNKQWDETPFEFDEKVKDEFSSFTTLPVLRKKEKPEKFSLPVPKHSTGTDHRASKNKKDRDAVKSKKKATPEGPKKPNYKLSHTIHFSDLEKVIFSDSGLKKIELLDYYNKMAIHMLPYLKDRPLLLPSYKNDNNETPTYKALESFKPDFKETFPRWFQTTMLPAGKEHRHFPLCPDKEHLLYLIDLGCVELSPSHSRVKTIESPDYIIITLDPQDAAFTKVIDAALAAKEVLDGLKIPAYLKTDGIRALQIYLPLDTKSNYQDSKAVGEFICRLIHLKRPDVTQLTDTADRQDDNVLLDTHFDGRDSAVIAPYCIGPNNFAGVATPLYWDEVKEGLSIEHFNIRTIFKRIQQKGDPFVNLMKKKINAAATLQRLVENYSFLF